MSCRKCRRCGAVMRSEDLELRREVLDVIDGKAYYEYIAACAFCRSIDLEEISEEDYEEMRD